MTQLVTMPPTQPSAPWHKQMFDTFDHILSDWRYTISTAAVLILLVAAALFWSHAASNAAGVDVVNGVPAVSTTFNSPTSTEESMDATLAAFRSMPPANRAAYMQAHHPHLAVSIVTFLRQHGKLGTAQPVDRVQYLFGSMSGVVAETAHGGTASGHFNDQLLALVYPTGVAKPIVIIVQCTNGLLEFPAGSLEQMQSVGTQTANQMVFTINRGQGLTRYVDYHMAIWLAQHFNLPIQKRVMGGHFQEISADEAYRLESQTDTTLVRPLVSTGDRFDLANMTYTPAD